MCTDDARSINRLKFRLALAVLAITLICTPSVAQQPSTTSSPVREEIVLRLGMLTPESRIMTERPYGTVRVGDPNVVDVVSPQSNRYFDLKPVAVGTTNVLVYDEDGGLLKDVLVVVDEPGGPTRIQIHNKSLLTSSTIYRCWPTGCRYVDETVAKEAAPQPPTTNYNYNYDVNRNYDGNGPKVRQ